MLLIVAFDINISVFSELCMKCIDTKVFIYLSRAVLMCIKHDREVKFYSVK